MKDLGLMGENTFSGWCASVGLIPNGSRIDKTGWDFFVEFPLENSASAVDLHQAAFECKVQIKATNSNKKKVSIKLSNLKRLVTVQMPAFFVFIEFGGQHFAQKAYVVHVDNDLISKVLERVHQLEQSDEDTKLNKKTMTISYDESDRLQSLDGECLKKKLIAAMGSNMADYVARKKSYLESTGFENCSGQIGFSTLGKENLETLIDVSLGIKEKVDISSVKGSHHRFGIPDKIPFIDIEKATLEMPDLEPSTDVKLRFRCRSLDPI